MTAIFALVNVFNICVAVPALSGEEINQIEYLRCEAHVNKFKSLSDEEVKLAVDYMLEESK